MFCLRYSTVVLPVHSLHTISEEKLGLSFKECLGHLTRTGSAVKGFRSIQASTLGSVSKASTDQVYPVSFAGLFRLIINAV